MARQRLSCMPDMNHARVDESIWGHRLRHDQTAWLLVLEMLNVAQACVDAKNSSGPLPDMGRPGAPEARAHYRIRFRNLLFNYNQKAAELAAAVEAGSKTSDEAWTNWLQHVQDNPSAPAPADFSSLKTKFDDFTQFERAIDLVRSTAINGLENKKGVYNRFLFPMCAESLYWEMGVKHSGGSQVIDSTYNSFTRAGTLLHIMLARSARKNQLAPLLAEFLNRESYGRPLVRQLQVPEQERKNEPLRTYLPYEAHPRFDLIAEDYISILGLNAPTNDKFLWLVPLSALHLAIYHAEVAAEDYLKMPLPLPLVCEVVAHRRTIVRQQAIESLAENRDLSRRAVDKYLLAAFEADEWLQIAQDFSSQEEKIQKAKDFISREFNPRNLSFEDIPEGSGVEAYRTRTIEFFQKRHETDFAAVHISYCKQAGLVPSKRGIKNRYAPSDQMLQSLVLANVPEMRPLEEFLDILFSRYGFVIGSRQQDAVQKLGRDALAKSVGGAAFRNNQSRLEARLKSMGMLRRLSDSQAYVINPLQQSAS